jgi:diguanylate cyclase (GGDEF)-like protein
MLKSINFKILINVAIFVLIGFLGIYVINFIDIQRKDYSLKTQSKLIEAKYQTNYKNFKTMSDEFQRMYQKNNKLIDFLFDANNADTKSSIEIRSKMYTLLQAGYKRLQSIGVAEIHFYLKNDTSFLAMSHPLQTTNEVLKLKKDIIRTNVEEPEQEGFKVSGIVSGVTFTYPLFDKYNQYIGGVEITFSTRYLVENIADDFTYDAHLLFLKESINSDLLKEDDNVGIFYEKSWETDRYMLDRISHKTAKIVNIYHTLKSEKTIKQIAKQIDTKKVFSLSVVHHYIDVIMTFIPLKTIHDEENSAYLVTYTQSDYLSELILENKYLHIIFLSILLLMFLFSSHIIISRDKFEQLALYDNVTKLPNRTLFLIVLANEINRASRNNSKVALLFIDLDGFKAVNDTYGHQIGDELLKHASNTFASNIRTTDMVARIGGDEFIIILPSIQEHDEAVQIASNLINMISKPVWIKKNEIIVGASIGVSIYPDHGNDADSLIKIADKMMYVSKNDGKNRVTIYTS